MKVAKYLKEVKSGVGKVLSTPFGLLWFVLASIGIFSTLYMIPVLTTPGNDIKFQFSIMSTDLLVIMILLAIGNGLVIAMQMYIHKEARAKRTLTEKSKDVATAGSLVVSVFSSTIACAACYSAVLSVLGLGTASFMITHRFQISFFAFVVTVYAIYEASKRINNHCEVCSINSTH
ncbi:hypothetical protein COY25_02945 [Candidatus Uhrbacteria bacterium CG_4_10_14_0_2_um_filter_41_7]|uniref:Uncharacterized protein n=1 Tax=Candidatus Uhrbacteria bacterium CG_4_9_14_3_um_filter_41_35 TaxID=1975034 RepID=A0A2M7XGU6_9BACT|nr:MAG: hypothetical protein COV92_00480 [Candidatus Uhrbacteria bacterium CG11_big_fil_rev_8_21_14_0_20_41_9]PIZ53829.1 MAG: hypothetical protein COY25_02945 [Candidatus Uhrbacteria bacterium CG_4_10_14_0_2_um_filter_41_7]PJA47091.1 MAG: hypothetical protein CO173_00305 [Candidatus Uhrbacteria bacterium CG_4_9_14_3_um_filter_41_35]